MKTSFELPEKLEPLREKFAATMKPFIKIIPRQAAATSWWQSKIGGHPYLPKNEKYPTTQKGDHLIFLAQINFEEVIPLDPFPRSGILQFYIADDDLYGLDFEQPTLQDRFRVLYFEKIETHESQLTTDFSFLDLSSEKNADRYLPFNPNQSFPLSFLFSQEIISVNDYRFQRDFENEISEKFGDEMLDELYDLSGAGGAKLGGYPFFTQEDPRSEEDGMELLLQLDSDSDIEMMWGDVGVANFFIRPEDLAKKDFSKVWYNWDCS